MLSCMRAISASSELVELRLTPSSNRTRRQGRESGSARTVSRNRARDIDPATTFPGLPTLGLWKSTVTAVVRRGVRYRLMGRSWERTAQVLDWQGAYPMVSQVRPMSHDTLADVFARSSFGKGVERR